MKSIFSILRRYYFIGYSLLDEDAYPEYDFLFKGIGFFWIERKNGEGISFG